ncbi:RNA polymerase sigma factor [Frigoriglobus tundricola]|uniref:Uncharacterized protein n=1 Tax=Frigoriglobus tundricola TaxID=2774151 RepID=A0A6M5Z296_9BACT|nr:sigma-70 family RNA polymerase sigma factor [Frigoriglobus tundricola]QJW99884.1 hypothetical protein FTUN_7507 [Frigoriglobus tundricola]
MAGQAAVLRTVMRSVEPKSAATDRELLLRFARENDQTAFAALVKRHTPMVLGVCRRALPTVQDAEDACQATFLVLAKRTTGGCWHESVANWLYATARRVAHNARLAAERRARREAGAAVPEAVEPVDRMTGRELLTALDRALEALPARYREPLVLCYLEGLTRDEAATRLGVPLATLHTRIDRARKRLHEILTRAGCGLGVGLLGLAEAPQAGAAPPRLVASILTAVSRLTPTGAGGPLSGGCGTGTLARTKAAVAAAFGLLAVGFALAVPAAGPPSVAPDQPNTSVTSDPKANAKKTKRYRSRPNRRRSGSRSGAWYSVPTTRPSPARRCTCRMGGNRWCPRRKRRSLLTARSASL